MLARSTRATLVLLCLAHAACSGSPGGTPPGPPLTPAQRAAALEAVEGEFRKVPGVDRDADNQRMLAFLRGRPEIAEAGIDRGSVWAVFRDGVELVVVNNVPPPSGTLGALRGTSRGLSSTRGTGARPAAPILPTNLPRSTQVRLLNTFGPGFAQRYGFDYGGIAATFRASGYVVESADASVEALKSVTGDGVFHWSTHGAFLHSGNYALVTSTPRSVEFEEANLEEFLRDDQRMAYATVKVDQDPDTGEYTIGTYVAITQRFIRAFGWTFATDAFVLVNACLSDEAGMKGAFSDAGASVYAGWNAPVDIERGLKASAKLFDHLLGANRFAPLPQPRMRPFDWASLKPWLDSLYYTAWEEFPDDSGALVFTQNGPFGILAPSIERLVPNEPDRELFLFGTFGADPGLHGRVTIGGTPVRVKEWLPYQITAELAASGAGSAGDVVVEVRGSEDLLAPLVPRKSNVVRLSEWRGALRYTEGGPGSLLQEITFRFHAREDFHETRFSPGTAPERVSPMFGFDVAPDSSSDYAASGQYLYVSPKGDRYLEEWYGGGTLAPSYDGLGPGTFTMAGFVDLVARTGTLGVADGATFTRRITVDDSGPVVTEGIPLPWYGLPLANGLQVTLDGAFGIETGSAQETYPAPRVTGAEQVTCRLEWDDVPLAFPPDPDAAR